MRFPCFEVKNLLVVIKIFCNFANAYRPRSPDMGKRGGVRRHNIRAFIKRLFLAYWNVAVSKSQSGMRQR